MTPMVRLVSGRGSANRSHDSAVMGALTPAQDNEAAAPMSYLRIIYD